MAVSKLNPVAAASSKTMFRTTLTSGTSYTVPAGVTYLNVTLVGGAGGGSGSTGLAQNSGMGGQIISSTLSATAGASITYAIGAGGAGGTSAQPNASAGGTTTFTGATSAAGGNGARQNGNNNGTGPAGQSGMVSVNYGGPSDSGNGSTGGAGGAGAIYIEYWA